jgi:hypothetical protein
MEEVFVNLTCINQTLNKIPMEEIFVNLTCINQTLNKIPMEEPPWGFYLKFGLFRLWF